jgi:hypothetical protein
MRIEASGFDSQTNNPSQSKPCTNARKDGLPGLHQDELKGEAQTNQRMIQLFSGNGAYGTLIKNDGRGLLARSLVERVSSRLRISYTASDNCLTGNRHPDVILRAFFPSRWSAPWTSDISIKFSYRGGGVSAPVLWSVGVG